MPIVKKIIYDYFSERLEEEKKKPEKVTFSPSSCMKCPRQLYYKYDNAPVTNPVTEHALLKMEMGSAVHLMVQDILKDRGVYKEGEELKEKDMANLSWRYRVDGVLELQDKVTPILEIKSTYASGWNAVENEPKDEHLIQLGVYMLLEKASTGVLLYIGRDNGFMVEYDVFLDASGIFSYRKENGEIVETHLNTTLVDLFYKLGALKDRIENKMGVPDRPYSLVMKRTGEELAFEFQKDGVKYKSDWNCNGYCPYTLLCWADVYEEINKHKFYIDGKYLD